MPSYLRMLSLLVILQIGKVLCYTTTDVNNLRDALFNSYQRMTRPLESVSVNVKFNLVYIADLNVDEQYLDVTGWFTVYWMDSRFSYTTSLSSVPGLHAIEGEVWRPELVVENTLTNIAVIADENLSYRIKADGSVVWEPPVNLRTVCTTDVTYFPFDKHVCDITLSGWSLDASEMTLVSVMDTVDTSSFTENSEWILDSSTVRQANHTVTVNSENRVYSKLEFMMTLKRHTAFYGLSIFLPLVILSILSLLVFLIPNGSDEKFSYSVTVVLAIIVYYSIPFDYLPVSKETSVLAIYLSFILGLALLTIVLELYVTRLYHANPKNPVPIETAKKLARLTRWGNFAPDKDEILYSAKDDVTPGLTSYVNGTLGPEQLSSNDKKTTLPPVDSHLLRKNRVRPKSDSSVKNVLKVSIEKQKPKQELTFNDVAAIWDRVFFLASVALFGLVHVVFICVICVGGSV